MKKIVIVLVAIVGLIGGGLLISQMNVSNEESVDYAELYDVGDLPLTVDQIPFSYELADVECKKVLNISYTNNSSEAIILTLFKFSSLNKAFNTKFNVCFNKL